MTEQNQQQQQQTQTGVEGVAGQGGQPQGQQQQQQQPGQQQQDPSVGQAFAAQRQNLQQQAANETEQLRNQVNQLQQQIQLYQANMAMSGGFGPPQPQQAQGPPPDPIRQVIGDDIRDDDPITVADARKILAMQEQGWQQTVQSLQFQVQAPDFNQVIQEHLPEILQTDPMARQTLATMRQNNPMGAKQFAYQLCKMRDNFVKQGGGGGQPQAGGGQPPQGGGQADDPAQQAQQIMQHMTNPGSAGLAQSGGAGGHSAADAYSNMGDDELEARINAVKQRG